MMEKILIQIRNRRVSKKLNKEKQQIATDRRNKKKSVNSRTTLRMDAHRKSRARYKIAFKSVLALVMVLVAIGLSYVALMIADAKNLADSSYTPRNSSTSLNGKSTDNINDDIDPLKDPISILLMGIDDNAERNLGSARTDTMLLLTINPSSGSINMVSIPRDTYTSINTKKFTGMDKINSAYTYGKDEGAIQAVQDLMNVPINYYFTVDFEAFEGVINALGGIEVDVPMDIHSEYASEVDPNAGEIVVHKGKQVLDGEKALIFSRVRKLDNDIERGKRQQLVVQKVIEKATEVGSITKYSKVIKALSGNFWTDMKTDTMLSIAQSSLKKNYAIHSFVFDWSSFTYNSASYVSLNEDSLDYISHKFRVSLGLDKTDERDKAGYKFETNGVASTKTYPTYGASEEGTDDGSNSDEYGTSDEQYNYNTESTYDNQ